MSDDLGEHLAAAMKDSPRWHAGYSAGYADAEREQSSGATERHLAFVGKQNLKLIGENAELRRVLAIASQAIEATLHGLQADDHFLRKQLDFALYLLKKETL